MKIYVHNVKGKKIGATVASTKFSHSSEFDRNDLWTVCETLAPILEDIIWPDTCGKAPIWVINAKRKCVFNNSAGVRSLFRFGNGEIATLAAVYTNNLDRPIDLLNFMCEGASLSTLDTLGLLEKIEIPSSLELINMTHKHRDRFTEISFYLAQKKKTHEEAEV